MLYYWDRGRIRRWGLVRGGLFLGVGVKVSKAHTSLFLDGEEHTGENREFVPGPPEATEFLSK